MGPWFTAASIRRHCLSILRLQFECSLHCRIFQNLRSWNRKCRSGRFHENKISATLSLCQTVASTTEKLKLNNVLVVIIVWAPDHWEKSHRDRLLTPQRSVSMRPARNQVLLRVEPEGREIWTVFGVAFPRSKIRRRFWVEIWVWVHL